MSLSNRIRNQHFVSAAEQRFNACDSERTDIYEFHLSRQSRLHDAEIDGRERVLIQTNLAFRDLFTFDAVEESVTNFENLFQAFENHSTDIVRRFLSKVENSDFDILDDLISIWSLKFLNMFRNPHCIAKTLNHVKNHDRFYLKYPEYEIYKQAIESMQQNEYFQEFHRITEVDFKTYQEWLKALLLMLLPIDNNWEELRRDPFSKCILGQVSLDLLTDDLVTVIQVHLLTNDGPDRFILSDRSHTAHSYPDDPFMVLNFNLTDQCLLTFATFHRALASPEVFSTFDLSPTHNISGDINGQQATIKFGVSLNDEQIVQKYNQRAIYYAKEYVYCSQPNISIPNV